MLGTGRGVDGKVFDGIYWNQITQFEALDNYVLISSSVHGGLRRFVKNK